MLPRLDAVRGVVRVLCPPFLSLSLAQRLLQGTSVRLGAQNAYFEPRGAYTGEVSLTMLKGLCQYVILGHSERRLHFGESDDTINRKVRAAIEASLVPILCVGERLEENRSGKTEEVVTRQLTQGLKEIPRPVELVIAYEPVWAIGTGIAATSMDAIAAEAGVSKATLYAHFKSKQALFESMIQERCRANMGENVLPAQLGDDPLEGLTALGQRFLGMLLTPDALAAFRLVLAETSRLPELGEAFYRSGPARTLELATSYIEHLNRLGRLKVADPALAADLFLAQLKGKLYLKCLLGLQSEVPAQDILRHARVAAAAFVLSFAPSSRNK